ncbi:hypothetical protein [Sandaracinus amylolyticus]|uniref:Uncharacterized protein n=1 Tax=Sandaracinus amylolyticus TaxID=927083 RepID=A0A0F6W5M9_9BACT|nr:hypothetical protein [Sandaracinus amylolyticus]AKF08112.1 hypothetical protein DB32_005261 [Sandaracinus amylolyticus]
MLRLVLRSFVNVVYALWLMLVILGGCCFGATPAVEGQDAGPVVAVAPVEPAPAPVVVSDAPIDFVPEPAPGILEPRLSRETWDVLARGPVPQVRDALSWFESAPPHESGALEGALVICRTMMTPGHDDWDGIFGGPEIQLRVRIAGGAMRATPEGRPAGVFSFPVARLAPRDRVWMRLIDEDVLDDDVIGEGSTQFAGITPFVVSMRRATLECRAVSAPEPRAALARFDRMLSRAEDVRPDVSLHDLGYPEREAMEVLAAASEAAAWLDWSDARLRDRIDHAERFERAWSDAAHAEMDRATSTLPDPATPVELGEGRQARVLALRCGVDAGRAHREIAALPAWAARVPCVAIVEVVAGRGGWTLPAVPGVLDPELRVVDGDGRSHALLWVGRRTAGAWRAPDEVVQVAEGERVELTLDVPVRDARLIHARHDRGGVSLLRVR